MNPRHLARQLALQALYELDCTHHTPAEAIENRLAEITVTAEQADFLRQLVREVYAHRETLDAHIHQHASEWPVADMAIVDRNILRMALWEIVINRQTPLRVAINEAVELAKEYGADSAPRFVNGVLGAVAHQLEAASSKAG